MASTKQRVYREGGWGWLVVLAACVAEFIVVGTLKAFGVLITAMKDDFNTGLWIIGSINSLHFGVQFILTPIASVVARKFGGRYVISFGGFLFGLGLVLSSVTHHVAYLAVTIIAIAGCGGACILEILRAEFAFYFHDKYDLAIFISLLGSPIGYMVYGPTTQSLLEAYGWRGAMLLLGGFAFNLVCVGLLVKRPTGVYAAVPSRDRSAEDRAAEESEDQGRKGTEDETSGEETSELSEGRIRRRREGPISIETEDETSRPRRRVQMSSQSEDQISGQSEDQISGQSEDQIPIGTADRTSRQVEDDGLKESEGEISGHTPEQREYRSAQRPNLAKWRDSIVSGLGLRVFTNGDFLLLSTVRMFYYVSYGGVVVYMVPCGLSVGLTSTQASFLSMGFGVGCIAGPAFAVLVQKGNLAPCQVTAAVGAVVSAVGLAAAPSVPSFAGQMVNTFFVAAGIGAVMQVVAARTRYVPVAEDTFVMVVGWMGFLGGLATSVGDSLSGLLYEATNNFHGTFGLYSASMVVAGLLSVFDLCRSRYRKWATER